MCKLYAPEHDSKLFLEFIADSDGPIGCSAIADTEMFCALSRKERGGDLKRGAAEALFRRFRSDCESGRIVLIPYGEDVAREAERLGKLAFGKRGRVMVRSLDLIHAASATVINANVLVTTDKRLCELASLLKIRLFP